MRRNAPYPPEQRRELRRGLPIVRSRLAAQSGHAGTGDIRLRPALAVEAARPSTYPLRIISSE
jgi:hypothetical protein